jgi:retron-type reverse transcriptase
MPSENFAASSKEGYRHALDRDLKKFFDSLNCDVLIDRAVRKVGGKRVLKLISK